MMRITNVPMCECKCNAIIVNDAFPNFTFCVNLQEAIMPEELRYGAGLHHGYPVIDNSNIVCISPVIFYLFIAFTALLIAAFIVYAFYSCERKL